MTTVAISLPPSPSASPARNRAGEQTERNSGFGEALEKLPVVRKAAAREDAEALSDKPAMSEDKDGPMLVPVDAKAPTEEETAETAAVPVEPAIPPARLVPLPPVEAETGSTPAPVAGKTPARQTDLATTDKDPARTQPEQSPPAEVSPATSAASAAPSSPAASPTAGRQAALDMLMSLSAPRSGGPARPEPSPRRAAEAQTIRQERQQPAALPVEVSASDSPPEPVSRMRAAVSEFALRYGSRGDRQPAASPDAQPGPALPANAASQPSASIPPAQQAAATTAQLASDLVAGLSGKEAVASVHAARDGQAFAQPQGMQSLRLQLQPIELGTVTIDLATAGERIDVEIRVETGEAHQRLSSDADEIVKTLRGLGFDVDRIQLSYNAPQGASVPTGREPQQMRFGPDGQQAGRDERSGRPDGRSAGRGEGDAQDSRAGAGDIYI